MKSLIFICFLSIFLGTSCVFADEDTSILDAQLDVLNIEGADSSLRGIAKDYNNEFTNNFSLVDIVVKAIKGEIDISPGALVKNAIDSLFKEVFYNISLMRNIIIIAVLGAILKNLTTSFKGSGVGDLSFYVCYILLIILLFQSFGVCVKLTTDVMDFLCKSMIGVLPVFIVLLISTGNPAMATAFHPIVVFAIDGIALFIKNILIPVITLAATLQIINFLSEKEVLNQLTELLKKGASWILKGCAVLFMSILSIQRVSVPILNGITNKGAKLVITTIPVVGEVLAASVDNVFYWAGAVKNGVSIGVVIFIALLCAAPILKLLALVIIYKGTAAIIQPVSDPRIVKCIDAAGSFALLLLSALITVAIMFIFSIMIVISVK